MKRSSPNVLLADPDSAAREHLAQHLRSAGYKVSTTDCGRDVILLCEIDPPDILILNVHLPDMDGFEVCEYVRRDSRDGDLSLILITEGVNQLERAYFAPMAEFAGGDYFLTKPFDVRLLVQLIDDIVGPREASSEPAKRRSPTHATFPTARLPVAAS